MSLQTLTVGLGRDCTSNGQDTDRGTASMTGISPVPDWFHHREQCMKFAYWALLIVAIALVVVGHFADIDWLIFVAIAMIVGAAAVNPKRPFFGLRKSQ